MKPYGRSALPENLQLVVCPECYKFGNARPLAKGVICPNCQIDLCHPCMNRHLINEELCYDNPRPAHRYC